jgi:hypothetical protein
MIRHNEYVLNILEGAISGKGAVGRLRPQYLKKVPRNTGVDYYTAMKKDGLQQIQMENLPTNYKIEG